MRYHKVHFSGLRVVKDIKGWWLLLPSVLGDSGTLCPFGMPLEWYSTLVSAENSRGRICSVHYWPLLIFSVATVSCLTPESGSLTSDSKLNKAQSAQKTALFKMRLFHRRLRCCCSGLLPFLREFSHSIERMTLFALRPTLLIACVGHSEQTYRLSFQH